MLSYMMCVSLSFHVWPIVVCCMGVGLGMGWVSFLVGCVESGSMK